MFASSAWVTAMIISAFSARFERTSGLRGVTDNGPDVHGIAHCRIRPARPIDNGDVVVFQRQITGDAETHLSRASRR